MYNREWTTEEETYLKDHWGKNDLNYLAKMMHEKFKIKRTIGALQCKALELKLGGTKENSDLIIATDVARLMGVVKDVVYAWIKKKGLKCKNRKLYGKADYKLISYKDLIEWLKINPKLWDARRIDMDYFKPEMDWIKPKLDQDKQRGRKGKPWDELEKQRAYMLWQRGYTIKQVADELGRTYKGTEPVLYKMLDQFRKAKKSGERVIRKVG
jgi:hypothetical protein